MLVMSRESILMLLNQSHENYDDVPKGGKYIYVVRNPLDVAMSYYSFLCSFAQVSNTCI